MVYVDDDRDVIVPDEPAWLAASRTCPECGRVFDMLNATDAAEWSYGHDCEPAS